MAAHAAATTGRAATAPRGGEAPRTMGQARGGGRGKVQRMTNSRQWPSSSVRLRRTATSIDGEGQVWASARVSESRLQPTSASVAEGGPSCARERGWRLGGNEGPENFCLRSFLRRRPAQLARLASPRCRPSRAAGQGKTGARWRGHTPAPAKLHAAGAHRARSESSGSPRHASPAALLGRATASSRPGRRRRLRAAHARGPRADGSEGRWGACPTREAEAQRRECSRAPAGSQVASGQGSVCVFGGGGAEGRVWGACCLASLGHACPHCRALAMLAPRSPAEPTMRYGSQPWSP